MAIRTKTFTILGFVMTTAYMVSLVISFSSDRWIESTESTGLLNIGLWSVCFKQYRPPPWVMADKFMDECFWTLDKELEDLDYLFPSWFVATQTLVTVSLVLGFIASVVMVINAINCFPYHKLRHYIQMGLCIASFCLHFIVVLLLFIAIIMFGVRSDGERDWVENPDDLYLSWSFGMAVLADFLALIAGLCQLIEFFRLRLESGLAKEPNVYLTNVPPPVHSSYRYSRENLHNPNQPVGGGAGDNYRGQPEYARKFGGSQGSINARGGDPAVFKVSGSGQLYVNRLAEHEENGGQTRLPQNRGNNPPQPHDARDRPDNAGGRRETTNGRAAHSDYEEARRTEQHPVLPEYVPKSKSNIVDPATEDSDLDDIPKKNFSDTDSDIDRTKSRTKSKESSNSKKKSKSRSQSDKRKSKKKSRNDYSEDEGTTRSAKRKSKRRAESSDDERSKGRQRSRDRVSRRKSSRSRSRDFNESYSDDQLDSDRDSTRGRSRRKSRGGTSRTGSKHRTPSGDRLASGKSKRTSSKDRSKKKQSHYHEDYSDNNISGSEYSSRHKSKSKTGRGRDFSDTESVRGKARRKPEQSYSSYYEY